MSAAYLARTNDELEELARDLPVAHAPVASRRRPTRFVLALLSSSEREGRLSMRRRVGCPVGMGNIDLDLRQATFDGDVITVFAVGVIGAIDVWRVPIAWAQKSWGDVIRGMESGKHKELET
jgi:hypothetical protein